MKNIFENSRSCWVRYDRYELKTAPDGKRYILGRQMLFQIRPPQSTVFPDVVFLCVNV